MKKRHAPDFNQLRYRETRYNFIANAIFWLGSLAVAVGGVVAGVAGIHESVPQKYENLYYSSLCVVAGAFVAVQLAKGMPQAWKTMSLYRENTERRMAFFAAASIEQPASEQPMPELPMGVGADAEVRTDVVGENQINATVAPEIQVPPDENNNLAAHE
jgi:hypothetical protein